MTITLPDEMREELEAGAKAAGFQSVDLYVLDRLMDLMSPDGGVYPDVPISKLTPRNRAELEAMLDEGMASGDAVEADDAFWAERRRILREKLAKKAGTNP